MRASSDPAPPRARGERHDGLGSSPRDRHASPTQASPTSSSHGLIIHGGSAWCREHDAFADVLSDRGVDVLYAAELLAETVKHDAAPPLAPRPAVPVRQFLEGADPASVARHLIGGVTLRDLPRSTGGVAAWRPRRPGPAASCCRPLPNHLFARDTTCWIYGGAALNPMATRARRRETAHLEAIYRFRPLFAAADFELWFGGVDHEPGVHHRRERAGPRPRRARCMSCPLERDLT